MIVSVGYLRLGNPRYPGIGQRYLGLQEIPTTYPGLKRSLEARRSSFFLLFFLFSGITCEIFLHTPLGTPTHIPTSTPHAD